MTASLRISKTKHDFRKLIFFCERCKSPKTVKQGGHVFRVCMDCAQTMLNSVKVVLRRMTRITVKELLEIDRARYGTKCGAL